MKRGAPAAHGSVRIIGGEWRGTKLPVADAPGLRPTADRMRETLFNWLQNTQPPALAGTRVLDLFAGSGALGIEAVSRGARQALLVEREPGTATALQDSVQRLKAGDRLHVVRADALSWLRAPLHGRFDLVFLDPPFAAGLWQDALALLSPWLGDAAWLYLESPAASPVPAGPGWTLHREARSRDAHHALYRRCAPGGAATLPAGSQPGRDDRSDDPR